MRPTTRRLMIAVAAVAAGLAALKAALWLVDEIREAIDEPFGAQARVAASWDLGPAPTVVVDCFEGTIRVLPAADGRVAAEVTTFALAQDHRAAADEGLGTIRVQTEQHGDTLRIVARGASEPGVRKDAGVELRVPADVRLDLRTGRGEIWVGWDYRGMDPVIEPVAAASIRARNDSPARWGYAAGNIKVATVAPRGPDGVPTPTRLLLDAAGRIEVAADLATIEARAWHGAAHEDEAAGAVGGVAEGSVRFVGRLAGAANSIRAAHRIDLEVAPDAACRVDAAATGGEVAGPSFPSAVERSAAAMRWWGSIGADPAAAIRLRTDDGPIRLGRPQP